MNSTRVRTAGALAAIAALTLLTLSCSSSELTAQGVRNFMNAEYEDAIEKFQRVLEHESATPEEIVLSYNGLADSHYLLGNHQTAYDYYSLVLISGPDAVIYNNRGLTLIELERYQEAIDDFSRALALRPGAMSDNFAIYLNRAEALDAQGRFEEAKQDLDVAITLNPELGQAYLLRSFVHADLGLIEESEADRVRAAELGFTAGP